MRIRAAFLHCSITLPVDGKSRFSRSVRRSVDPRPGAKMRTDNLEAEEIGG